MTGRKEGGRKGGREGRKGGEERGKEYYVMVGKSRGLRIAGHPKSTVWKQRIMNAGTQSLSPFELVWQLGWVLPSQ